MVGFWIKNLLQILLRLVQLQSSHHLPKEEVKVHSNAGEFVYQISVDIIEISVKILVIQIALR